MSTSLEVMTYYLWVDNFNYRLTSKTTKYIIKLLE
jgi:hypothetical protein